MLKAFGYIEKVVKSREKQNGKCSELPSYTSIMSLTNIFFVGKSSGDTKASDPNFKDADPDLTHDKDTDLHVRIQGMYKCDRRVESFRFLGN